MAHEDVTWILQGDCIDAAPDEFFPERGAPGRERQLRHVKQICAQCPVQQTCLDYALRHDERHGMWGGLTYRERQNLLRRQHQGHPHAA